MKSSQILISIFCLLISMIFISISAGIKVQVDYQVEEVSPESLPDELNATIVDESGRSTFLQLQRAKHIVPNIPVYTLNVDNEGKFFSRREILQETENVGYYQDVSAGAALQVEKMEATKEKSNHFILSGEVTIAGQNYKLDHGLSPGKRKVGAAPLSEYSLKLIPAVSASEIDFINPTTKTVEHPEKNFFQNSAISYTKSTTNRVERQTSGPTDIYIELVAVADYAVYKRFRSESRPKDKDLNLIRTYFSFVANGINMRYRTIKSSKYNFHVRMARLIVSETAAASSFTEDYKIINNGVEILDGVKSIEAFANFTVGAGKDVIFPRDHAMLFTGYDIFFRMENGEIATNLLGLAYIGTLCQQNGSASSINEDRGDFRSVPIATHELGHSLGARHDGDNNSCSETNGNIMGSRLNKGSLFSDCSISYFEQYISDELSNGTVQKCFLEQLPVSSDIPDVSNRLLGQEYSVDEQCQMYVGNGSTLCREYYPSSEICTSIICRSINPTAIPCINYEAFQGTTCGNRKMCLDGLCVADPRAPAADDDCLFGDNPGVVTNNQTCEQFINSNSSSCYQSTVKKYCCTSCKKAHRKISGCEYGDTVTGCDPTMCNNATAEKLQNCCGTCNYETPLPESINTQASAFVTESQQAVASDSRSPVDTGTVFF